MTTRLDVGLIGTVFGIIFVAQLPGKSALTALVLATRQPLVPVALGAGLALALHSAIAVGAGGLLTLLPQQAVRVAAGCAFVGSAIVMWRRKPEVRATGSVEATARTSVARTFVPSFAAVFVAEWGDLTQLGTAALAARYHVPLDVFFGATLGLWAATGAAISLGKGASRALRPEVIQKVAAVVFGAVGVALIGGSLW